MYMHKLDVITIGRSSVDIYGQQVGGRLEDMGSFSKALGGSPTNTAFGAARLGPPDRLARTGSACPLHSILLRSSLPCPAVVR